MSKHLTNNKQLSMVDQIIHWICKEDLNGADVRKLIAANSSSELTEREIANLIEKAFEKVAEIHAEQNKPIEIVKQHISWYEQIYDYFKSINHASGCNKAMQAKERLLNILNESNKVTLKRSEKIIHETSALQEYDLSKLAPEEQERLKYLLKKASS